MQKSPFHPEILRSQKWQWHIPDAAVSDAVRGLILSDDCMVKRNPVRAVYKCGDFFLKFEHATNLPTSFRNRLRPKARQEYEIGRALEQAGIPAVQCLGWGMMGGTNVLVTRALPCSSSLEDHYYRHIVYGEEDPEGIVAETTEFLRKFFDAGFFHKDLHFGNILYNPETRAFAWVDLIAIRRPGSLAPVQRLAMCRSIVTLREGLSRMQMLRAIRAIGAAATDDEAERFFFGCIRRDARRLLGSWGKRRSQILGGYQKFTDIIPCPGDPARKLLLRKDWLSRPILRPEEVFNGLLPAGYESFHAGNEAAAETLFLRSMYLQILRIRHRRVAAFIRPDELLLEPLPVGLEPMPPAPDDPDTAFSRRTLEELEIEGAADSVRRLPNGTFYLPDLTRLHTGFEA